MSTNEWVFLISLFAVVASAMLMWKGRRGRLVGRHLHCGRCEYDLSGQSIDSARCPECGSLIRYGRPRGKREPQTQSIKVGAWMLPPALLFLSVSTVTQVWRIKWIHYEPLWFVIDRVRASATTAWGEDHLEELEWRMALKKLPPADLRRVAAMLLAYQADADLGWNPAIGEMIEQFRLAGYVGDREWQEYMSNGPKVSLKLGPAVAGERITGQLEVQGDRYGLWVGDVTVRIDQIVIDGQPTSGAGEQASGTLGRGWKPAGAGFETNSRLPPGPHELLIRYTLSITDSTGGTSSDTFGRTIELRQTFDVAESTEAP